MERGKPTYADLDTALYTGEALSVLPWLPDRSVDAVVTSPPYLDSRPDVASPTLPDYDEIFRELARVVTGGMLWNVGRKWVGGIELEWWNDLLDIARVYGWERWDTLVWIKPNANPIHGRIVADSHELVLVLGRQGVEFNTDEIRTEYDPASIARLNRKWVKGRGVKGDDRDTQDGRTVNELGARARSFVLAYVGREKGNPHPTPMPLEVATHLCVLATKPGGTVLDPFAGSGTTGRAARLTGRRAVLVELDEAHAADAWGRLAPQSLFST